MARKAKSTKSKSQTGFTSSTLGRLVHEASSECGHLRRIPKENLQKFKTLKAAVAAGKKPCTCAVPKPPTPRRRKKPRKENLKPGIDVVKGPATAKTHVGGRFAKGNPGGPGNPHFKELHQTRKALSVALRSFDPVHVFEVLKTMYLTAISGDKGYIAAAKIFLEYTLGKPTVTLALKTEGGPMAQLLDYINKDVPTGEVVKAVEAEDVTREKRGRPRGVKH